MAQDVTRSGSGISPAAALTRTLAHLSASLDPSQILQNGLDVAREVLGADVGIIRTFHEGSADLVLAASAGLTEGEASLLPQRVPLYGGEISALVGRSQAPICLSRSDLISEYWPPAAWRADLASLLCAPLIVRARLVGTLLLGTRSGRAFHAADVILASSLGQIIASIFEKATLYAEARASLAQADRQRARAEALAAVGRAIAAGLPPALVVALLLEQATELTGAKAAVLMERGEPDGALAVRQAYGIATRSLDGLTKAAGEAVGDAALAAGRLEWSADVLADPRFPLSEEAKALFRAEGIRAVLAAPIRGGGEAGGLLNLYWGDPHPVDPEEATFAARLADDAAVALETNRRRAEPSSMAPEDFQASREGLVPTDKLGALAEMAAGVAHRFNNILARVLVQADLLLLQSPDAQHRARLEAIRQAAADGADMVRRISGFAVARPEVYDATVDLTELVSEAMAAAPGGPRGGARQRGAAIETVLDLEPVSPVRGNAEELREALRHLIANAVEAMPEGGRLTVGTRPFARPSRLSDPQRGGSPGRAGGALDGVEVFVRDTGTGMSDAVRRRAVVPFFTTKGSAAAGLGLSVVYGIVVRHGGEALLESRQGAGTTVTLRLPAWGGFETPRRPTSRTARVVVVDDDQSTCALMENILRSEGHNVRTFMDPRAAIASIGREPVDLVLTDLHMPEMSGLALAQEARALRPGLPVALVTAEEETVDPMEARQLGVVAVVGKPFKVENIVRVVADLLRTVPTG